MSSATQIGWGTGTNVLEEDSKKPRIMINSRSIENVRARDGLVIFLDLLALAQQPQQLSFLDQQMSKGINKR